MSFVVAVKLGQRPSGGALQGQCQQPLTEQEQLIKFRGLGDPKGFVPTNFGATKKRFAPQVQSPLAASFCLGQGAVAPACQD